MGNWYDARVGLDGEWRFRRWSSIVDRYLTGSMTEEQARADMLQDYSDLEVRSGAFAKDIDERIARAKVNGTTARPMNYWQKIDGPWEQERCRCGVFHHEFVLRESDGKCSWCGEATDGRMHTPPCAAQGE